MGGLSSLFDWLSDFFKDLLSSLESDWLWVFGVALPEIALLTASTLEIGAWLSEAASWVWTGTGNLLESLWGSCVGLIDGAIEWIIEVAGEVIDFVIEEIAAIAEAAVGVISSALGPLLMPLLIGAGIFFLLKEDKSAPREKGVS
jgi:hypothetical protein